MKKWIVIHICGMILLCLHSNSFSETGSGMPVKYISSCELDLNNDNKPDIVLLVETTKGRELIVLMRANDGYTTFVLSRGKPNMHLSCHFGKSIKETSAGKGKREGKVYKTPGTYIQLAQPEGASAAYFWNGKGFKEVWTSD
jgi:hypothetical protein